MFNMINKQRSCRSMRNAKNAGAWGARNCALGKEHLGVIVEWTL